MNKVIEKVDQYVLYALVFLLPLTFLSISPNPFVPAKLALLVLATSLLLIVTVLKSIMRGKLVWNVGKFDFPVLLITLSYIASSYFMTPNKMEAILLPGTTTAIVSGALVYFMLNQVDTRGKELAANILFASGVLVSIFVFIAITGSLENATSFPSYMRLPQFNPTGGHLPGVIFLATLLPIGIALVIREKDVFKKSLSIIASVVVLFALVVSTYTLLPGKINPLQLPKFSVTWPVAIDSLKDSPLLGVGPGNYLSAFNRYRPAIFNNTNIWQLKFSTANSFYLTLMTETGMLGVAGLLLLLFSVYKLTRAYFRTSEHHTKYQGAYLSSLLIIVALLGIFPATVTVSTVLFITLSLVSKTKETTFNLSADSTEGAKSKFPALVLSLPVIALVIFVGLRGTKILAAEYNFKLALDSLARNEGVTTYNLLRKTIEANPYVDRYHARYSQVNLAIANSLAANVKDGKISDEDRDQITQLVRQAVREARATVTLNPTRSGNWELLGRTYQAIIPLAKDANSFAAQSYTQAVLLDPTNPGLRIALGGIYYAAKDYTNAVNIFGLAVRVKPDLANAHYNLAFALREAGELNLAKDELTTVLSLVDRNTKDYETARKALEEIETKVKEKEAAAEPSESLTEPQDQADQVLNPPVELTEEETPPEEAITPTPTPEEGSEATITPPITPTPQP